MNYSFTIGFKFREKDYTAGVAIYSTSAFTFFQVNLNDEVLIKEFGPYLNFSRNALTDDSIVSLKLLPEELENSIATELRLVT